MPLGISGLIAEALRRSTLQVRCSSGATITGSGSAIILEGGRVVTNAHVISGQTVMLESWSGTSTTGTVIRVNRRFDLALLSAPQMTEQAATLGDSDRLRAGMPVIAVGNPLGFVGAASSGVIHAQDRRWIQADVRLAPGNSGGPLATADGQVVGINTMVTRGGLALAVPSRRVQAFLNGQKSRRLGATLRPVRTARGQTEWLILELVTNGPAHRASLLPGDLLVLADGLPIRSADDFQDSLDRAQDGLLKIQFRRGGEARVREVVLCLTDFIVGQAA